ncbi:MULTISPECIES: hypothetical protein [unclassified Janthinobacterium]|uniref:hypothetical protein n=1 Tax=unclassified Janthinobacterium TaxID=2610881 RepID=UPI0011131AD8|nr:MULTISPECIES: hypothetical protein [unclassified Janthinobacterium]
MNKPANYLRQPATFAGNGRLYRGIVSLPNHMTNGAFEERIVFFESKTEQAVGAHLEALLEKVWCVDTKGWCDDGMIYNINSARELHEQSLNETNGPSDLMLFETGAGGTGIEAIGPNRTHYAQADTVDMFVTPRVARRLRDALEAIELARSDEARRRKAE